MTKRGLVILLVLIVIVGGAIGGIIMFLSQMTEPSPAVSMSDSAGFPAEEGAWSASAGLFTEQGVSDLTIS